MKLDENYRIEHDSNNIILKYEKENGINEKTGKMQYSRDEWYFPKMSQALDKYVNQAMKVPDNVQELIQEVKKLDEKVSEIQLNFK